MFLIVDQLDLESITHLEAWRQQQLQDEDDVDPIQKEIVKKEAELNAKQKIIILFSRKI